MAAHLMPWPGVPALSLQLGVIVGSSSTHTQERYEAVLTNLREILLIHCVQKSQLFDYSKDDREKEFSCASSSPTGQAIVLGSFDRCVFDCPSTLSS